jgi:hypothetical protein
MAYLIEPWQQHAARPGDAMIVRNMPVWNQDGWRIHVLTHGGWCDTGLPPSATLADAEHAARAALGVQ